MACNLLNQGPRYHKPPIIMPGKQQQLSTTDTASSKFLSYPAAEAPVSTLSELPSCDLGGLVSRLLCNQARKMKPLKSDGYSPATIPSNKGMMKQTKFIRRRETAMLLDFTECIFSAHMFGCISTNNPRCSAGARRGRSGTTGKEMDGKQGYEALLQEMEE